MIGLLNHEDTANHKKLPSFDGLENFNGRMIPNFATKMLPLIDFRIQVFEWAAQRTMCFQSTKQELCSKPVVQPYSLDKEVTDHRCFRATSWRVISQEGHLVIYISRKLSPADRNYCNIEREALTIMFVVKRVKQFLLGCKLL